MQGSIVFNGRCWRMKFLAQADDVLAPATAPEGRSHHGGQRAIYLSTSPEGTVLGTRRYMRANDPPRAIFPLNVRNARIVDLRDPVATARLGIDTTHRAIDWHSLRALGQTSPTWAISDRVRELGLDGMLYASSAEPARTHLTLFRWNEDGAARLTCAGPPQPWPQP